MLHRLEAMLSRAARLMKIPLSRCIATAASRWIFGIVCAAALGHPAAEASERADFHSLFEARCLRCHGHAGEFVRRTLELDEGVVRGRDGRDAAVFLRHHAGGLEPREIELFVSVFARQIESDGFFQTRCRTCHGAARDFARIKLVLRDGGLRGRYTNRDVAAFLIGHGRMSEEEAEEMVDALTAILLGGR